MKRFFTSAILVFILTFSATAQYVVIPDTIFRNYLQQNFPACFNTSGMMDVNCVDLWWVNDMIIPNMGITDLTGIEHISGSKLDCSGNLLTWVPPLVNFSEVDISNNQLQQLTIWAGDINCSNNLLTSLTINPGNVHSLNCSNNLLTSLPPFVFSWVGAWTYFNCSNNQLTSLPPGYEGAFTINVDGNQFTQLDVSGGPYLKNLYCRNNLLTNITLPTGILIDRVDCSNNFIASIQPGLKISELLCSNNALTSIPYIVNIQKIKCNQNNISSIAQSPTNYLDVSDNPIDCLPTLYNYLQYLNTSNTNITCMPNQPFYISQSLPLCQPVGSGSCETFPTISGSIFLDTDGDNQWDSTEVPLPHWVVQTQPFNWYGVSAANGNYFIHADTGVNVITNVLQPLSPYYTITPASYSFNFNSMNVRDTANNFAVHEIPGVNDLRIALFTEPFVPGNTSAINLNFSNIGTTTQNATVNLVYPASLDIVSVNPVPTTQTPGNISWTFPNCNPFYSGQATVYAKVDTLALAGTPLAFSANISPVTGDSVPDDNSVSYTDSIVSSFDPNDKHVDKITISPLQVQQSEWLYYKIRFQNTGTYFAANVSIIDSLSNFLDPATIQVTGYSHNYEMLLTQHGILRFDFRDIMLPWEAYNEPESHGFISFRIKVRNNLLVNDQIHNNAYIYFDFNSPILTNSAITTVDLTSGESEPVSKFGFTVFPNPANEQINIASSSDQIHFVEVVDITGRIIKSVNGFSSNKITVNVKDIDSGIYLVKVNRNDSYCLRIIKF